MSVYIQVSPLILKWAIERSGLTILELMRVFPQINKWLKGEKVPTFKQIKKLAKKTHTPLGYFFIENPPKEELPVPYFRTKGEIKFSIELYDTVSILKRRQDWLREYLIDEGYEKLSFVGSLKDEKNSVVVANKIREYVGLKKYWASEFPTWTEALDFLKEKTEEMGIIVVQNSIVGNNTRRKIKVKECRGFVLVDKYAPFIFINSADAKAAQMFTLAHELAHILIGESAIFDLRELQPAENPIEELCDRIAAEFLLPASLFKNKWGKFKGRYQELAKIFKVSELVIARRALDFGYIRKKDFLEFYKEYIKRQREVKRPEGGDFYRVQEQRLGRRFVYFINIAAKQEKLLYRDAYRLTGLRGNTFEKLLQRLM